MRWRRWAVRDRGGPSGGDERDRRAKRGRRASQEAQEEIWYHQVAPIFDEPVSDDFVSASPLPVDAVRETEPPSVSVVVERDATSPPGMAPIDVVAEPDGMPFEVMPEPEVAPEPDLGRIDVVGEPASTAVDAATEPPGAPRPEEPAVAEAAPPAEVDPPMIIPIRAYYLTRTDDTLRSIAAQFLNSPSRWKELQSLNAAYPGVASAGPDTVLPVGSSIALPGDPLPWGRPDPVYLWTLAEKFLYAAWGREPSPEEVVPFWRGLTGGAHLLEPGGEPPHALESPLVAPPEPEPEPEAPAAEATEPEPEPEAPAAEAPEPEPEPEAPAVEAPEPEPEPEPPVVAPPEPVPEPEAPPAVEPPVAEAPPAYDAAAWVQPPEPVAPTPYEAPSPVADTPPPPQPPPAPAAEPPPEPPPPEPPPPEPPSAYEPPEPPSAYEPPEPPPAAPPVVEPPPEPPVAEQPVPPDVEVPPVVPVAPPFAPAYEAPPAYESPPAYEAPPGYEPPAPPPAEPPVAETPPAYEAPPAYDPPGPPPGGPPMAEAPPGYEPPAPEAPAPGEAPLLLPPQLPSSQPPPPPAAEPPPAPPPPPPAPAAEPPPAPVASPRPPSAIPAPADVPPTPGMPDLGPIEPETPPDPEAEAPPLPAFMPSVTGPAPPAELPVEEVVASSQRGLAGTAIGDAMLLWQLGRLRRRRRATAAAEIPDPIEQSLEQTARMDSLRLIEAAMRQLRAVTVAQLKEKPRVVCVRVGTYGFEVLLEEPVEAPEGWTIASGGYVLELPHSVSVEELDATGQGPSLCPALVPVGDTAEGPLLLNIEEIGCLAISGPAAPAAGLLTSIVETLGSSPLAGDIRIITVGVDAPTGPGWERIHAISFDSPQLEQLLSMAASPAYGGSGAPFDVLVVGSGNDLLIQRAGQIATTPGSRLALVGATSSAAARWPWRIHVDETTRAVVHPIACTMIAAQAMRPELAFLLGRASDGPPASPRF